MSYYAIATILSFVTACFTMASSWTKDPRRTYWYQVGQCLVYAVASYFYGVYPGIIMMLINAARNGLVGAGKYTSKHCIVFSILAVVAGLWVNGSGVIGLLAIIATVQYTICSYFMKKPMAVKWNIVINLLIWAIYDILVRDVFSGIMDVTAGILAIVTVVRILRESGRGRRKAEQVNVD